jgi:uncharacterized integral membrane protein
MSSRDRNPGPNPGTERSEAVTDAASHGEAPLVTQTPGSGKPPDESAQDLGVDAAAGPHDGSDIPRTRAGAAWVAAGVGIVLLVGVLVFILQNLEDASVHFLGASVRLPIGVALLFSALAGALAVLLLGISRIVQLRLLARRRGRARR